MDRKRTKNYHSNNKGGQGHGTQQGKVRGDLRLQALCAEFSEVHFTIENVVNLRRFQIYSAHNYTRYLHMLLKKYWNTFFMCSTLGRRKCLYIGTVFF